MNKIMRTALFSKRDAQEQRIRDRKQGLKRPSEPDDVRVSPNDWNRAAEGFRRHDPTGEKLAKLLMQSRKKRL